MPKKIKPVLNTYAIISDCIETSIPAGIRKFLKYHNVPITEIEIDQMTEHILNYVMVGLDEVIKYGD